MKKTMKALAVCAMLTAALCALAGCGKKNEDTAKTPKEALVGVWTMQLNMADELNDTLKSEGIDVGLESYMMDVTVTFNDDDTYTFKGSISDSENEKLKAGLMEAVKQQLLGMGMTEDMIAAAEDQLEAELESSLDAIPEQLAQVMDLHGKYDADKDKIYMSRSNDQEPSEDNYEAYTLSGNTLTLTASSDGETAFYPMTFTRSK